MSNYIKMVDASEDELMHYGVLGMKWHHHKANYYKTKRDTLTRSHKQFLETAGAKRVDSEIQRKNHNPVTSKRYAKEAKQLEKSANKLTKGINKYDAKMQKYVDKMNAGFDEERDKVMKSKKYSTLQKQIDNANDAKAAYKKSLDRGDYDEFEVNEKFVASKTKEYEKQGMNHLDARQFAENDAMAFDAGDEAGRWKADMNRYNSDVASQDNVISKAKRKQDKMTDKVEKKRKKYVSFAY